MKIGDLVCVEVDREPHQVIGILLRMKKFNQPKYSGSYIKYSIEVFHSDIGRTWYDFWNGDKMPTVLR